jgi:hypothetical protein
VRPPISLRGTGNTATGHCFAAAQAAWLRSMIHPDETRSEHCHGISSWLSRGSNLRASYLYQSPVHLIKQRTSPRDRICLAVHIRGLTRLDRRESLNVGIDFSRVAYTSLVISEPCPIRINYLLHIEYINDGYYVRAGSSSNQRRSNHITHGQL